MAGQGSSRAVVFRSQRTAGWPLAAGLGGLSNGVVALHRFRRSFVGQYLCTYNMNIFSLFIFTYQINNIGMFYHLIDPEKSFHTINILSYIYFYIRSYLQREKIRLTPFFVFLNIIKILIPKNIEQIDYFSLNEIRITTNNR